MDEITKLIQSVFLGQTNGSLPRAVAFCGVNRGVGSTWVCARTGELLAEVSGATVCLLDGNLRSPALHLECGAPNSLGFADLMRSSRPASEYAQKIAPDVWLLTAGTPDAPIGALLNANSLGQRFVELRAAFDFLVVDTPALNVWSDALLLGRMADGVVMVVGSDSTRREAARNAKASLEMAQVSVLGAVLNRRTFPIPDAIYTKI
ncbi:MAG: CpsD/CapB family tyrosine-protein kinase [Candidatus Acidiferrales bacterium]